MSIPTKKFVKAVYQIYHEDREKVIGTRLSKKLQITCAAVTDMAQKLSQSGLLKYVRYKEIELTKYGNELAISLVRNHRLWETFLYKTFKMPWHEVHSEAEMLEYTASDNIIDKIDAYLDFPKFDPHGDPIPDKNGIFPSIEHYKRLNECEPGYSKVVRIRHHSEELNAFFVSNDIYLGTRILLKNRIAEDDSLLVKVRRKNMNLSSFVASNIFVEEML